LICSLILFLYTMHSCMSSSLIPTLFNTSFTTSLSSRPAHHASPQPAEIVLGTGISLPGAPYCLQAFSAAIASDVVWNVTTSFNSFALILIFLCQLSNCSNCCFNFFFRIIMRETESNCTLLYCSKRFMHKWRTMCSWSCRDSICHQKFITHF